LTNQAAKAMLDILIGIITVLDERIAQLDRKINQRAKAEDIPSRLMTIPGIGPITATALAALAPPPEAFKKGRDFAAWVVPRVANRSSAPSRRWASGPSAASSYPPRAACWVMAGTHACTEASHARHRCFGQQDGANHVALLAKNEIYRAPAVVG
jgi:hypothetical protein